MSAALTPEVLADIDRRLDEQHGHFADAGSELWEVFGAGDEGRINTQMRNLQQIAVSAARFGDVEDFVKNQMGRQSRSNDDNAARWRRVGDNLLAQLYELRQEADKITPEPAARLSVRLRLVRGWVRAVIGEYLYRKAQAELRGHK
jgi:hypothetical protein